jgi:hypothetical protein
MDSPEFEKITETTAVPIVRNLGLILSLRRGPKAIGRGGDAKRASFRLSGPIDNLLATRLLIVVLNPPNSPNEASYDYIRNSRLTLLVSISRSVPWLYGSGPTISRIICYAKQLSRKPSFLE